jgi:hypothetical protein
MFGMLSAGDPDGEIGVAIMGVFHTSSRVILDVLCCCQF